MPTIIELGQKTKAKYPEYADMSDIDIGKKVKAKYPTEYADFTDVSETVEKPKSNVLEKTANILGSVFGGNKIGEAIGTQIAKAKATPEEKQFIEPGPTPTQLAGDVGRVALNFFPAGRVAKGLGLAGSAVKLGKLAKPLANIATGAGIGYGADVTTKLADGAENPFEAGTGTAIGTGLASVPYVGKALAKGGQEILGATTGTGAGTIKQFSKAITEGGEGAKVARDALRNNIEPQEIVDEARTAFGTIIKNRSDDYSSQLSKLKTKTNVIDHTPIIEKFNKQLEDFGVFSNADGTPNFSRSPGLGRYEKDLQALSKTLSEWGTREGDNTIAGVDKLKQVIDDFRIGSSDSKKFDSFVTNLRSEAKNIIRKDLTKNKDLKTLLTYDKMLGDFEKSTKDIREIQKALSLGDKASTDTAFRKLSTVLRTNNEIRQKAVQELNEITGGTLIPKIAGQQLSEILPRGIARTLGTVGAGAGVVGGVGILPMLKLAAVSSPRVVGELLNALGIVGNKANIVKNAILKSGVKTPGDYLFDSISAKTKPLSKNKGSATTKALLGGSGLTGLAGLTQIKGETTFERPKEAVAIENKKINTNKLGNAIMQLESSGGTNNANADAGEKKWIMGLTEIAIKELKNQKLIDDTFDKNNEKDVIDAGVKYFNLMKKRNPKLSDAEIYVDKYWSQWKTQEQRKKKMDEFNRLTK